MEKLDSQTVYEGRVFDVTIDRLSLHGNEFSREIVWHSGSAVVLPVFENGDVGLVRQYRAPAGKHLLELPAGTLEMNENPEDAALRELEEEIGVTCEQIEKLTEFWVSPGFLTEKMHLFVARGLKDSRQNLDEDEFLDVVRLPFRESIRMVRENRVEDAKTMVGLLLAEGLL